MTITFQDGYDGKDDLVKETAELLHISNTVFLQFGIDNFVFSDKKNFVLQSKMDLEQQLIPQENPVCEKTDVHDQSDSSERYERWFQAIEVDDVTIVQKCDILDGENLETV